ncbi:hypothetical protein [Hydrogenimonas sp.]
MNAENACELVEGETLGMDIEALGALQYAFIKLLDEDSVKNADWVGWYLERQAKVLAQRAKALFEEKRRLEMEAGRYG